MVLELTEEARLILLQDRPFSAAVDCRVLM